ncbi:MAG: phosphate ABC transporter permease PstA [Pseudomonadota bacterium]
MTDISQPDAFRLTKELARERRQAQINKRFAAETRFKYLGLGAVALAVAFLGLLLSTVVFQGLPAFAYHYVKMPIAFGGIKAGTDPKTVDYDTLYKDAVKEVLPFASGRKDRRVARGLFSAGSVILLQRQANETPELLGTEGDVYIPVSDFTDLYLKELVAKNDVSRPSVSLTISKADSGYILTAPAGTFGRAISDVRQAIGDRAEAQFRELSSLRKNLAEQARIAGSSSAEAVVQKAKEATEALSSQVERKQAGYDALIARQTASEINEKMDAILPSLLVHAAGGTFKATMLSSGKVEAVALVPPSAEGFTGAGVAAGDWTLRTIKVAESNRKFSDKEVAMIEKLRSEDRIERRWNSIFFGYGASREPEMAGVWGAVVGSFFTMLVTLAIAFPLGVSSAIYLEEFAPKNRITQLIEVNINNLAAVPSIVFGLLGLAVFLNWFSMPRSAPLVGGAVLALMTLPTIIIASRAALKAVPPSIREAALGVGASRIQAVFHHVLPLAMPGILTGTIIGMAQALGETAPLLMIGMVAFIVDVPGSFTDPATVLPVQIFMWADFPEPLFQQKTAAAILILLGFLVIMNAIAVLLRKRFERRW